MATAKKSPKSPSVKKTVKATPIAQSASTSAKPVKETFTKAGLSAYLAEQTGVEPKSVKSVLTALETAILGSLHKKGTREFTLPGLLKIGVLEVPAKKKRIGKDPFTGEVREFAAKPATVRIKARALKKLKDAAL